MFSSCSAQVRIAILDLSIEPGLVCDLPRGSILARAVTSLRSMVAADIPISRSAVASSRSSSR